MATDDKVAPGAVFGRLTIVRDAGVIDGRRRVWVQCECGSPERLVRASSLLGGNTVGCGCLQGRPPKAKEPKPKPDRVVTQQRKIALPGMVYGRLTVLREGEKDGRRRRVWVQCECGSPEKLVRVINLSRTRSCGCLTRERSAEAMRAMHAEKREAKPKPKPKPKPATRVPIGESSRAAPVVEILVEDGIRMATVSCPFCGKTHDHCVPLDTLPTAGLIRTSKCAGRAGGLYQIVGVPGVESEAA